MHRQLRILEAKRDSIPPEFETSATSYRKYLDEREAYWEQQLDDLEDKATRVAVPQSWRWAD